MFSVRLAVDARTFLIKVEFALCGRNIAVDLPGADTFCAPRAEPDEAVHVPGGIAEKQTDLVRKRGVLLQAAAELRHAAVDVADRVCTRGENRPGS